MNSVFSTFLDRLAERFTAILASVVSSRVESLRAEVQALADRTAVLECSAMLQTMLKVNLLCIRILLTLYSDYSMILLGNQINY